MIRLDRLLLDGPGTMNPSLAGTATTMILEGASWFIGRRYGRQQELEFDLDYWRGKVDRLSEECRIAQEERDEARGQVQQIHDKLEEAAEAGARMDRLLRRQKHAWKRLPLWRRLLRR